MIEVVVISTGRSAGIGVFCQVMTSLTGSALVAATTSAALTGGVASLTAAAVTPEPPGALRYTQSV